MMKWFNNVKIAVKLLTGFIIVAIIAGAVGVVGMFNIKSIEKNGSQLYSNMTVPLSISTEMAKLFQRIRVNTRDMVLEDNLREINARYQDIKQIAVELDSLSGDFEKTIMSDRAQESFDDFIIKRAHFLTYLDKLLELCLENRDEEAFALIKGDMRAAADAEKEAIEKLVLIKVEDAKVKADTNTEKANAAAITMIIIIAAGMILAVILGLVISGSISKPVKEILNTANKIAVGDLDVSINYRAKDEIGLLAGAFEKMAAYLDNAATAVKSVSEGNINIKITSKSESDTLSKNMTIMIDNLHSLAEEGSMLTKASIQGNFHIRGDEEKFNGVYRQIIAGMNRTLDTLVGHINNVPAPVVLIDRDFKILYINKYGADVLASTQSQIIGTKCYDNFKTSDCKTPNCACAMAMQSGQKSSRETDAHPAAGIDLDINYTAIPLKDENQQIIGAMELVVDQTAIKNAARVARKQSEYQEKETSKLLENLQDLSKGKLRCSSSIEPTDEDTKAIGEMFDRIYLNYKDSVDTIAGYVEEISKILNQMSEGNMNVGITRDYRGDFVEIKNSLNLIVDSFNDVLGDINNSAEQVAAGSKQVSDSSTALSQGAAEQASTIEELTASLQEISSQTELNAKGASQSNELSETAKTNAVKGNEQMQEMLKAMAEINDSSSNISKIIKVIDEIAFQTNILALNAAVEAARAGQHGKGFAVVAEEVRNLAARSANAAKETTAMIEGSIKKVEGGTRIANDTAEALNSIVEGVTKVAKTVNDISIASNEQASAIVQINQGIVQVSDVVQNNSATSEESAAASEELSSQSEKLREMVARFKLKASSTSRIIREKAGDLSPEVLRVLDNMPEAVASSNVKSGLSDNEFGKY